MTLGQAEDQELGLVADRFPSDEFQLRPVGTPLKRPESANG